MDTLRIYAIVRNDIGMSPGKCCSQAGHCVLSSFLEATTKTPDIAAAYAAESPGTKVCLTATGTEICRARIEAEQAGIPHFLVVDSGCKNFFNGEPIITGIGIGPVTKDQLPNFIKRLKLLT